MNIFKSVILILGLTILGGCSNQISENIDLKQVSVQPTNSPMSITPTSIINKNSTDKIVAINTSYGQILVKLYVKEAPNTVANFIKKIDSGFYSNLTFHRVEPEFVVQGGDPLGNGTGGSTIKSEINNIPFRRGSLGLARGAVKEISNDSQFFICLSDNGCQHLTNEYVNFGEVVSGMELVDQIKVGDKIINIQNNTK